MSKAKNAACTSSRFSTHFHSWELIENTSHANFEGNHFNFMTLLGILNFWEKLDRKKSRRGWGQHSTVDSILASQPSCLGLESRLWRFFSENISDVSV